MKSNLANRLASQHGGVSSLDGVGGSLDDGDDLVDVRLSVGGGGERCIVEGRGATAEQAGLSTVAQITCHDQVILGASLMITVPLDLLTTRTRSMERIGKSTMNGWTSS